MTKPNNIQPEKGNLLNTIHHNGKLLVLPNIWDPLGAILLESLGYAAVATASASIAFSNGYPDGEKIPFKELLHILRKIVNSVTIPVTADIESGYATNSAGLQENIKMLLDAGIAGINFEDTNKEDKTIISIEAQCKKLSLIRNTASGMGVSLFINARTDVYLKANDLSDQEKLAETILRGKAYKDAGADGFYPIFLKEETAMKSIVKEVGLPVNILILPGIPRFEELQDLGIARVSLGPGFLKIAINAMKNIAEKLLRNEGMQEVTDNPVTSAYLNTLISK
ncbi:isocitrate lyase/phosphoenolpyruvate mutase family protein [Ginsengibacter hankyongi]|uniref:Isocitrate lyase/phosphoenolpyruvate mutase family protein n=1 Tax=Ginsengibacter hankyongi TaxID=2607284 RepID=A0A5J5IL11_9BACT|nr:isocitrate lyase/phosphoenolpyruvate mutase family protein [Ginsengibacter hankyongi]KAA9040534.1 isocitrate lyase/phosphoenolpyruvate mutase family protein [Ginsengibacter hankyongi]